MKTIPLLRGSALRLSAALLCGMAYPGVGGQAHYAIEWFSTGGSGSTSMGGAYSAAHAAGVGDSDLMESADYSVAGNFGAGAAIVPEPGIDALYAAIDVHDPAQALNDPEGSGFSTLLRFGLGTDPRDPAAAAKSLLVSVATNSSSQHLTMQFRRRHNAGSLGLQYVPEVSADGQTWYSDTTHVSEINSTALDPQFDWVTVQDQVPTTGDAPRFFRLRIIEN